MTASRVLRAGASVMVGIACARPQTGTDTAVSHAPATPAVAPREDAVVQEPLLTPVLVEALLDADAEYALPWRDAAAERLQAPVEAARSAPETPAPPAWSSSQEPDYRREEQRLRAAAAAYRAELRALEDRVRLAERAVEAAEVALGKARETPKTLGGPMVSNAPCVPDEPVVILPPPDIASMVAAAEERLRQARAGLKAARDAEDDLFTKMRRERIPLSDVL